MRVGTFVLAGQFAGQAHDEVLHRVVRSAEVAEEAGLDAVWLAEHHFIPYGICPSAATLAGFLLGRTRRIGVGTAVSVLPTTHPVSLGEQAALLHLTSEGRFTLGVGRGGPWIDLSVFGTGLDAYERDFPEALDLLLRWLREERVGAAGDRFQFPSVPVVPRPDVGPDGAGPPVVMACTSPRGVRTAALRGLPMLLGMHADDEERAEMVALWRRTALESGAEPARVAAAGHVAVGVVQVGDSRSEAVSVLRRSMPEWFRRGLGAYRTADGRPRRMRDPLAYTELLCEMHPVGTPRLCADRLAGTAERTGVTRFALLPEGSGRLDATEENLRRLGAEVLPLLPRPTPGAAGAGPGRGEAAPPAARAASGRAEASVSSPAVRATG